MIKTTDKTGSIKLDKNKNRYWELAHKRYFFRRDLKRDKDLISLRSDGREFQLLIASRLKVPIGLEQ